MATKPTDEFVVYRGVRMISYWPQRIAEAQLQTVYLIGGREFLRLRFGEESPEFAEVAAEAPCHDCRVFAGELHVPSCDMERCPACSGQSISCDCEYAEGQR